MEDIQEIKGMFEDGFFVNTELTKFIDEVLSAPGNLIGVGGLEEPVIINRDLCIKISGLFYINNDISYSPIKDKCFYVHIGLLNFIYRILKVGFETEIQMTDTMAKKDYLLGISKHPLIYSAITKIYAASEGPKEQELIIAERCWLIGEIENAEVRGADYLQVKYKVNGVTCKHTVDINKWRSSSPVKRCEIIAELLDTRNFEGYVKDEDSLELLMKIKK